MVWTYFYSVIRNVIHQVDTIVFRSTILSTFLNNVNYIFSIFVCQKLPSLDPESENFFDKFIGNLKRVTFGWTFLCQNTIIIFDRKLWHRFGFNSPLQLEKCNKKVLRTATLGQSGYNLVFIANLLRIIFLSYLPNNTKNINKWYTSVLLHTTDVVLARFFKHKFQQ